MTEYRCINLQHFTAAKRLYIHVCVRPHLMGREMIGGEALTEKQNCTTLIPLNFHLHDLKVVVMLITCM